MAKTLLAVGKAAGGAAGIGADEAGGVHAEVPQGFLQLQTAPAHIGAGLPTNFDDSRIGIEGHAGLIGLLTVHIDQTGHDDGLGLGPCFRVHLLHEEYIQSLFILHCAIPRRPI